MTDKVAYGSRLLAAFFAAALLVQCPMVPPAPRGEHWLRFVQITDVHVTDEESPARLVRLGTLVGSAWRPQEAYATQVLDATLQVVNQHNADDEWPVDFVAATGDLIESAQYNELGWFMDIMDGRWTVTDSGDIDGPLRDVPAEDNPNLGFQAVGLAPEIPWYAVLGNHDSLSSGTFGIERPSENPADWISPQFGILAEMIGLHLLDPPRDALMPTDDQSPAIMLASDEQINPETLDLEWNLLEAGPIPPDANRHYIAKSDIIERYFDTATQPVGHGFIEENRSSGDAWYTVRPNPAIPIRLVVLDTSVPRAFPRLPMHYGVMSRRQFDDFLKPAVEEAAAAGEFVIVLSHHPSEDFNLPYSGVHVRTQEFRTFLAAQGNVIAHFCGHTHRNRKTMVNGPYPYPEIETGSLIDYPQEARIVDVYYDAETDTATIATAMISHMEAPTRLSSESFRRASIDAGHAAKSAQRTAEAANLFRKAAAEYAQPETAIVAPTSLPVPPEEAAGKPEDRQILVRIHLKNN